MAINKPRTLAVDTVKTARATSSANELSFAMDAIAVGVEAKLDPFSAYSKIVTQRTIGVAWQLGIAEEEIRQWVMARAKLDFKRNRMVKSEFNRNSTSTIFTQ